MGWQVIVISSKQELPIIAGTLAPSQSEICIWVIPPLMFSSPFLMSIFCRYVAFYSVWGNFQHNFFELTEQVSLQYAQVLRQAHTLLLPTTPVIEETHVRAMEIKLRTTPLPIPPPLNMTPIFQECMKQSSTIKQWTNLEMNTTTMKLQEWGMTTLVTLKDWKKIKIVIQD